MIGFGRPLALEAENADLRSQLEQQRMEHQKLRKDLEDARSRVVALEVAVQDALFRLQPYAKR
jgi:predicted  nucleic acid-binding Zn-ribbon protein